MEIRVWSGKVSLSSICVKFYFLDCFMSLLSEAIYEYVLYIDCDQIDKYVCRDACIYSST